MYEFHTNNEYKKRLYNNKIKIIIYTPRLYEKCGGVKALHRLAQEINKVKHTYIYAKIYCYDGIKYLNEYCNNFANPYEINENTIVVYPEIVSGNPLNAKHVLRWILLDIRIEMGIQHYLNWNKTDIVYYWEPSTSKTNNQLTIPFIDKEYKNYNNTRRTKTCFLIKKGPLIHNIKEITWMHPPDSIKLDNLSIDEVISTLNESHTFYCYDPNTFYILGATICGCITVMHPITNMSKEIFLKNRMTTIDDFTFDSGIAYGNSIQEVEHARSTVSISQTNLNILLSKYELKLNSFMNDIYNYFINKQKLITIEYVYY